MSVSKMLRRYKLGAEGKGKARRYPRATVEAIAERLPRGSGIATSNHYLTAAKGFTRWMTHTTPPRWPVDPLAGLSKLNAKTDVCRERRALPEAELQRLLATARASGVIAFHLAGTDRAMLYAVAMGTGFRVGELASLAPECFDLATSPATVTVQASYSKRRRRDTQPLPADVAAALRGYLTGKPARHPVWPGNWHDWAADMLRVDLEAAGIPFEDDQGRVCEFHALRHSFITLLERSGVSPKLCQELARHSDIRLTSGFTPTPGCMTWPVPSRRSLRCFRLPSQRRFRPARPDRALTKTVRIGAHR